MILAIDPGTKRTGWILFNGDPLTFGYMKPALFGISKPMDMRPIISKVLPSVTTILIEKPV